MSAEELPPQRPALRSMMFLQVRQIPFLYQNPSRPPNAAQQMGAFFCTQVSYQQWQGHIVWRCEVVSTFKNRDI